MNSRERLPVFFIRHNFKSEKGKNMLPLLAKESYISILVDQDKEKSDYEDFHLSDRYKQRPYPFIRYWFKILDHLYSTDVLIISQYESSGCTIGILEKGQTDFDLDDQKEFKALRLKQTINVLYKDFPLLYAVLPKMGTISSVKQRLNFINHLYYGHPIETTLENLTPKQIEGVCLEWLRSEYAGELKLKYQLLPIGGNMPNIDIIGKTINNEEVVAQVSHTDDMKIIHKKLKKLESLNSKHRLLFSNAEFFLNGDICCISLKDVWNDLIRDPDYKQMLETQIKL